MFKRIWEALKGQTYVNERCADMVTLSGIIPAVGRWGAEPYRVHVWTMVTSVTRDAFWVAPIVTTRLVVEPISNHRIPVPSHSRVICVTELIHTFDAKDAPDMSYACDAFVQHVVSLRQAHEEARISPVAP